MAPGLALDKIRIVDFSWAAAGPYATLLLAFMGAQCIKIETGTRELHFRSRMGSKTSPVRGPYQIGRTPVSVLDELSANKLSITLNLKRPSAREVVKGLVRVSDALVENFSPGVMRRLGVDYDEIREVNPRIVWLSMSTSGQQGPESMGLGGATVFSALGGTSFVTGYEDGPPVPFRLPSDLMCGTMGAFTLLWGLYRARATGKGTFIDLSNREVHSTFIGEFLLSAELNKRNPERGFAGGEAGELHNIYQCKGDDSWVSIAIGNDQEWRALWTVLGLVPSVGLSPFGDAYLPQLAQEEMDRGVSQWLQRHSPLDAMAVLQEGGVPAVAVFNPQLILESEHIANRGDLILTQDLEGQPWVMIGPPWKFSVTPGGVKHKPPRVGEDTDYVLRELLGLSTAEVSALRKDGALD